MQRSDINLIGRYCIPWAIESDFIESVRLQQTKSCYSIHLLGQWDPCNGKYTDITVLCDFPVLWYDLWYDLSSGSSR
jgi:hypothetical protein